MRPYSPLELAGRDIYIREGCYNCHSQMIRPLRDEVERYGHYSLAAESMYDHPFQWGSKRTGPDLARVGGKYSDAMARRAPDRLRARSCRDRSCRAIRSSPSASSMPRDIAARMQTLRLVGVPYTDEMIDKANDDLVAQINPDSEGGQERPGALPEGAGAQVRRHSRRPSRPSSMR